MKTSIAILIITGTALLVGCGSGNDMTKAEMDAGKNSKPPTAAQMQHVMSMMAAGAQESKNRELAWAKANPEKVAAVNAARARSGKPPLGH